MYNSYRRPDADGDGGASRKRKAPMARDDPPQPEKKRKARDPATVRPVGLLTCMCCAVLVNRNTVLLCELRHAAHYEYESVSRSHPGCLHVQT